MSSTVYKKFTSFESLTNPFPLLFLLLLFFWLSLVLFCFVCISSELEAPFLNCCVREVINYSLSSYIRSLIAIFLEENLTKKQICHVSRGAHIHQWRKKLSQFIIKNHCWNKIALRTTYSLTWRKWKVQYSPALFKIFNLYSHHNERLRIWLMTFCNEYYLHSQVLFKYQGYSILIYNETINALFSDFIYPDITFFWAKSH